MSLPLDAYTLQGRNLVSFTFLFPKFKTESDTSWCPIKIGAMRSKLMFAFRNGILELVTQTVALRQKKKKKKVERVSILAV